MKPFVRTGIALAGNRAASACMDLSDGLADAVRQIAEASGVGITIDANSLPVEGGTVDAAIAAGDDYELLLIEEADAWFEYLEATQTQSYARYGEIEPWAWARLTQRLRAIKTKKTKLRPAAA